MSDLLYTQYPIDNTVMDETQQENLEILNMTTELFCTQQPGVDHVVMNEESQENIEITLYKKGAFVHKLILILSLIL